MLILNFYSQLPYQYNCDPENLPLQKSFFLSYFDRSNIFFLQQKRIFSGLKSSGVLYLLGCYVSTESGFAILAEIAVSDRELRIDEDLQGRIAGIWFHWQGAYIRTF